MRHALTYSFDRDLLNADTVKLCVYDWVNFLLKERNNNLQYVLIRPMIKVFTEFCMSPT